jgi:sulfur carrier protein
VNITLNGTPTQLPDGSMLLDALATLGLAPDQAGVAVAIAGRVVRRVEWPVRPLLDGERVEVVTASQGG